MKRVSQTKQFARDIKRMKKRGKDLAKIQGIVKKLAQGNPSLLKIKITHWLAHGSHHAIATLNPTGY
jgi:mRNA-degrading endonuclease YafQ of YafQ-DinJ toxin-antitoxin module